MTIKSLRPTFRAKKHLVSSVHYLASMAGLRILEAGGNAADAGVATGLCLNVLETELTHFGGVAPIIYAPGDGQPVETISGLGRWPQAASLDYFRQEHGNELPFGILRCVTPAAPDAWLTALARFGSMTFEQVVQPALDLAENGRPVDHRFQQAVAHDETRTWPTTAAIFNSNGQIPQIGELHYQKDLANTFRRLIKAESCAQGDRVAGIRAARDLIYRGEMAREIVAYHQSQGGLLTYDDLANFSVRVERPEQVDYREYEVYSCGPWCQGPAFLILLKLLESFDLRGMGHNSDAYLHTLVEAVKLVMADREAFIGDPDFVQVPMSGLLADGYCRTQSQRIDPTQAMPDMPASGNPWPFHPEPRRQNGPLPTLTPPAPSPSGRGGEELLPPSFSPLSPRESPPSFSPLSPRERGVGGVRAVQKDTSYVCVVDQWGNTFSATPSDGYGSSPIIPGLGFPISARGSQSWTVDDHPSVIAPGKRPRLTPNPALVLKGGKPLMPIGTPGADAQIQAMAQVFLNIVEFGMEPQEAIEAPRIISRSFPQSFWPHETYPGEALIETRIPAAVRDKLRQKGHKLVEQGEWSKKVSRVCTILIDQQHRTLAGGADPRSTSYAVGW